MSEKRRGLGRGLGALIPTSLDGARSTRERPVDVFFPDARPAATTDGVAVGTIETDVSREPDTRTVPESATPSMPTEPGTASTDAALMPGDVRSKDTDAGTLATTPVSSSTSNGEARPSSSETRVHDDEDGAGQPEAPVGGSAVIADDEQGQTPEGRESDGDDSVAGGGNGRLHGDLATVPEPRTSGDPQAADDDGLIPVPGAVFAELPLDEIRPNPRQPRTVFDEEALDELVGSIREIGVLQPVVVRRAGDGYELIMGERRWRAAGAAGLDAIPAIIRETGDEDLLRDALLENLHRSQLNPLEEAAAYQQLLDDFGCTHDELATRLHRSRPQISNTLRLLKLPPLVQRRVAAGVLSAGHARALLGLADGAAIERLAQRIVAEGLSVRAVEEIVALGGDGLVAKRRAVAPRAGARNEALDALAGRLSDRFETRVKVALGKSRGRLTVEFASVQDLNRILGTLAPEDPGLFHG